MLKHLKESMLKTSMANNLMGFEIVPHYQMYTGYIVHIHLLEVTFLLFSFNLKSLVFDTISHYVHS
jgi:hypothetical protein